MARVYILDADRERREQLVTSLQRMLKAPDQVERLKATLEGCPWPGSSWEFRTEMSTFDLRKFIEEWTGRNTFPIDILVIHIEPYDVRETWRDLWDALGKQKNLPSGFCVLFWTDSGPDLDSFGKSIRQVQRDFQLDAFTKRPFIWIFPSLGTDTLTPWLAHTLRFLWRASCTYPKVMQREQEVVKRGPGIIKHAVSVSVDLTAYRNIVSHHSAGDVARTVHQWLRMALCLAEVHLLEQLYGLPIVGTDYVTGVAEISDANEEAQLHGWQRAIEGSLYVRCAMYEHERMLHVLLAKLALVDEVPANTVQIGISPGSLFVGPAGIRGEFNYIGDGLDNSRSLCASDSNYRILAHASCPAAKLKPEYMKVLGKDCFEKLMDGPSAPYYAVLDPSREIKI